MTVMTCDEGEKETAEERKVYSAEGYARSARAYTMHFGKLTTSWRCCINRHVRPVKLACYTVVAFSDFLRKLPLAEDV